MGEPIFSRRGQHHRCPARPPLTELHPLTPRRRGYPTLRKAVAERSRTRRNGIPCGPTNVIITPAKQAIFHEHALPGDEGDEVILPDPSWGTYEACVRAGRRRAEVRELAIGTEFRMTPEAVAEAIGPRTKMIREHARATHWSVYDPRMRPRGIADLARTTTSWWLSDEVYRRSYSRGSTAPSPPWTACSTAPSPSTGSQNHMP